jgi:hypothetical protein
MKAEKTSDINNMCRLKKGISGSGKHVSEISR